MNSDLYPLMSYTNAITTQSNMDAQTKPPYHTGLLNNDYHYNAANNVSNTTNNTNNNQPPMDLARESLGNQKEFNYNDAVRAASVSDNTFLPIPDSLSVSNSVSNILAQPIDNISNNNPSLNNLNMNYQTTPRCLTPLNANTNIESYFNFPQITNTKKPTISSNLSNSFVFGSQDLATPTTTTTSSSQFDHLNDFFDFTDTSLNNLMDNSSMKPNLEISPISTIYNPADEFSGMNILNMIDDKKYIYQDQLNTDNRHFSSSEEVESEDERYRKLKIELPSQSSNVINDDAKISFSHNSIDSSYSDLVEPNHTYYVTSHHDSHEHNHNHNHNYNYNHNHNHHHNHQQCSHHHDDEHTHLHCSHDHDNEHTHHEHNKTEEVAEEEDEDIPEDEEDEEYQESPKKTVQRRKSTARVSNSRSTNKSRASIDNGLKGDKQFKCTKCSSSFTRKTRLTEHMNRVHMGKVYHFKCNICGTRLSSKENLTRHSIVHTDKFKCQKCNRRFDRSYRFQRHIEKCNMKC